MFCKYSIMDYKNENKMVKNNEKVVKNYQKVQKCINMV